VKMEKNLASPSLEGLNPSELLNLGLDPAVKTPLGSSQFVLPEPDELSERIPDLEFIEPIGSGGMGGVFLARQRHLDRLVAVKGATRRTRPRFAVC
jgi:serine/threonine protein kinase